MRAPKKKRPRRRAVLANSQRPDRATVERARYIGSPEHKTAPSFAGAPRPRADASICDPRFLDQQDRLTEWLREALRSGAVGGPVEGDFPRYVWYRDGDTVYEGRLVNRGNGEYKGYPLEPDEWPRGWDESDG